MTLIVDVRTDYKSPDYKTLCADGVKKAAAKSYDELKQAHIKDYNTLYNRVSIHFGQDANRALPTDVRWKQVKEGKTDTGLDALFFNLINPLLKLLIANSAVTPMPMKPTTRQEVPPTETGLSFP